MLVRDVLGSRVAVAFKIVVIVYTFGVCVGYEIIIGDLLPEMVQTWTGKWDRRRLRIGDIRIYIYIYI